jgi:hypothetical protein
VSLLVLFVGLTAYVGGSLAEMERDRLQDEATGESTAEDG